MTMLHFNSNYMHLLKLRGVQTQAVAKPDNPSTADTTDMDYSSLALQRMRDILRQIDSPASKGKNGRYRTQ